MSEDVRFNGKPLRPLKSRPLVARDLPGVPWPLRPGSAKGDLPDINVWLALAVQEHPHHAAARDYWGLAQTELAQAPGNDSKLWFCRTRMHAGERHVATEDCFALLSESGAHRIRKRPDSGDDHHAKRQARHKYMKTLEPTAQFARADAQDRVPRGRDGRNGACCGHGNTTRIGTLVVSSDTIRPSAMRMMRSA